LTLELVNDEDHSLVTLLVGKRGPEGMGCFVRTEGSSEVFLAHKNLLATFGIFGKETETPEPKPWADLEIIRSSKDTWSRLEIVQPEISAVFAREEERPDSATDEASSEAGERGGSAGVWVQREPTEPELETKQIQAALDALERLRGTTVVDPTLLESYGLADAAYRAIATLEDGKTLQLLVSRPQEDGPIYAKLDGNPQVFEITEASLRNIFENIKKELTETP
jgi:hypothetical protein